MKLTMYNLCLWVIISNRRLYILYQAVSILFLRFDPPVKFEGISHRNETANRVSNLTMTRVYFWFDQFIIVRTKWNKKKRMRESNWDKIDRQLAQSLTNWLDFADRAQLVYARWPYSYIKSTLYRTRLLLNQAFNSSSDRNKLVSWIFLNENIRIIKKKKEELSL